MKDAALEKVYQSCKAMMKDLNINVITVKQHPRPPGYYPAPSPPVNGIIFFDYITLLK